ncbi:ferric reductase [Pseudomassariella vexata]|uniref:ferric-chelate reductase (NADPH) n=1 Tax=Pseudomassariella vexata TaxID=1141098 RepID=A0A1Y2E836_9PEZI|nr:ferric reductase [Pseudomassariella vexata]ORY67597.1 ferric reductase [Pseudomassariella vexata]
MDMEIVRWLDQPVMLHSSRADTCKLTAEQCAYRIGYWRYWYEADHRFALPTVYLFIAAIALCTIAFWSLRLAPSGLRKQAWWQKLVSSVRFIAYRRYEVKALHTGTSSVAVVALLIIGAAFFLAMTLGPSPYYWPNTRTLSYGSSPPLATRTGWMALACLPFLIILPTKANMIATLTGVSHERLIVFHNWVGWAMFALALVHTFPFIIFHIWKGDMVLQWNTSVVYWTGVAAIIPQAYLQVMSLPWISTESTCDRNRYYEFFKATHYFAAILFVVFFFLHCDFRLTSWDYFIATGVLYTLSFLYSQIRTYFEFGVSHRASFALVSDLVMKITVPIDTTWQPGQHFFLRFLTLGPHALTAHPFTICSVPSLKRNAEKSKLVFYVSPRGGMTGRLASLAAQQPNFSVPVLLDGPYGGLKTKPLHSYDHSLVIACGAGSALSVGLVMDTLLHLYRTPKSDEEGTRHQMQVVIATRDRQFTEWYEEALTEFMEENGISWDANSIQIMVYLTAVYGPQAINSSDELDARAEKGLVENTGPPTSTSGRIPFKIVCGRPDISAIVRESTLRPGVSVGIATCGPAAVLKDTQNAAADAQLRILSSEAGAREVYLHSEVFT